jgi:hypothetical protein
MLPSGMLRRVAYVRTDVSKELIAFIFRVTRISKLGTKLVTAEIPNMLILVTLMMEDITFFRNVGSFKSHTE